MAKPLKIALAVIGLLIVLVFGAVLLAATFFDPNDYRDQITAQVKKQTGRDLSLGNIELSVFPWLKARVNDVRFSNAPGFGDEAMAEVKEAAVGVQVLPLLLRREVQVSTVTLDGLRLKLAKDADGKTNWDDLIEAGKEEEEVPAEEEGGGGVKLESIDIAGVTLRDAFIDYRDATTGEAYRLENVSLDTGALRPGEPMDIKASLSAIDEMRKLSADLALSSTVLADLVAQQASLDNLSVQLSTEGEGLSAILDLAAQVSADLEAQVVTVQDLRLDFQTAMDDMKADGVLAGKVLADLGNQTVNVDGLKLDFEGRMPDMNAKGALAAQVRAALDTQQFEISGLSLNADASGAAIPGGQQSVKLSGAASFDAAKGALKFTDGKIAAAGLDIKTSITGEGLMGDSPRLSGPLQVASFNPRTLLKSLGQADIPTTDPKVLSNASLSADYSGSFNSVRLDNLQLKLDDTNAAGSFAVRDFATQALEFALKVDKLDADRYLPPEASGPAEAPQPEKQAAEGPSKDLNSTEIPLAVLEDLNASGTLDVTELKLKGATMRDVRLKVDGPKGAAKQIALQTKAFGGQIDTQTRIAPGAKPTYALNTSISTLQLAPVLQTFVGKDYVSGLGNIKLDLSSGGRTVGDLRKALNGDLSLNFENGAVKGFNLGQIIRRAQATLQGQKFSATEPEQTDFTSISFAAKIVDGVLKSDQLDAMSPLLRLNGNGEIDLVNETLNYLASPTVAATSKGQGGKGLEELAGLTIPIRLTGSLFAPSYKLDLQTALKQKAGDELRGKVADKLLGGESGEKLSDAELKAKAGEKLNKEIGRGLEKLFGGSKKKEEPAPAASEPATEPEAPSAATEAE
ncbi:AsmA family protein [Panacagrimonas sp.]|uniref:AsmA family protein n=1 Tax=Panacagrimonas sp. TaxID=2480088 RepID=UPI003B52AF17